MTGLSLPSSDAASSSSLIFSPEGYPIEVSPKIAFAIELRKARAGHSQKEVAEKAGMTYQQYQRLENPHKTNPTLETLYKLQQVFNRPFLAL